MGEPNTLLSSLRDRLAASRFHSWAGMEVVDAAPGAVTVAMQVEHHVNLQGLVHGGMLAILADTACGLSIRSAMEPGRLHVTADLDIHFLAPAVRDGCSAADRRSRSADRSRSRKHRSRMTRGGSSREPSPGSRCAAPSPS
jgi:uncharacterized protein (TIGR00369 family)